MKKNSKGFTLVELLAVIVVLAVIMVIATTQISGVIKKNTVDSFKSSLDVVAKEAKTAYIQYGDSVTADQIKGYVDYDTAQYDITVPDSGANAGKVCITSKSGGKFSNMDTTYLDNVFGTGKYTFDSTSKQTTACKDFK